MKAESSAASAAKATRNHAYARPASKRVSSAIHQLQPIQHRLSPSATSAGVSKSRNRSQQHSILSPRRVANRSPSSLAAIEHQRKRQQQVIALEREVRGLLEEEYRDDVEKYMHEMELQTMGSPTSIDMQPELQWHMRGYLVEFLMEVHLNFRLRPETLYLTCNIVDRYVSRRVVYKKHYQLVGCAALWIAAKFEDAKERVPTVRELVEICRDAYDESAFIQMEGHVLATIAWKVGHPTAEAWLRIASCGMCFEDTQTQHVARFLMEITLFYREYVQFPPSVIASAALLLARYMLGKPRRPTEETDAIISVVQLLDEQLGERLEQLSEMLVKKYSYSYYSKASIYITQFYLQGRRYIYMPPVLPTLLHAPVTPLNKTSSRSLEAWPSSSSGISTTPSFSSEFTDISSSDLSDFNSMPTTPVTPSTVVPNMVDSYAINSVPLAVKENVSAAPVQTAHSSQDKENMQIVGGMVMVATAATGVMSDALATEKNGRRSRRTSMETTGSRSRKSSLETVQASFDPAFADINKPSPRSREATYIPRAALHAHNQNRSTETLALSTTNVA